MSRIFGEFCQAVGCILKRRKYGYITGATIYRNYSPAGDLGGFRSLCHNGVLLFCVVAYPQVFFLLYITFASSYMHEIHEYLTSLDSSHNRMDIMTVDIDRSCHYRNLVMDIGHKLSLFIGMYFGLVTFTFYLISTMIR